MAVERDQDRKMDKGNPGNLAGEGRGRQSCGRRGQKIKIKRKDILNYQQGGRKKKTGTHVATDRSVLESIAKKAR